MNDANKRCICEKSHVTKSSQLVTEEVLPCGLVEGRGNTAFNKTVPDCRLNDDIEAHWGQDDVRFGRTMLRRAASVLTCSWCDMDAVLSTEFHL